MLPFFSNKTKESINNYNLSRTKSNIASIVKNTFYLAKTTKTAASIIPVDWSFILAKDAEVRSIFPAVTSAITVYWVVEKIGTSTHD